MRTHPTAARHFGRVVLLLWIAGPATAQQRREPDPLVVVVAANSKLRDISIQDLRRIYTKTLTTASGGERLIPLNQAAGARDRLAFDNQVLGMSADEVGRFWVDRKIRGEGQPPKSFASQATLRALVAAVPGTIAYVRASQVVASVRVLSVNGHGPDSPGYPFGETSR